jgi:hypothetical protein
MKKTLIALLVGAGLLAAQTESAQAQRWVAPAVVGGLFTGAVIANALQPHVYYAGPAYAPAYTTTAYCAPAPAQATVVYQQPAPVVYQPAPVAYAPAYPYYYGYYGAPVVRVGWGWRWGGWGWGRDGHHPYHR